MIFWKGSATMQHSNKNLLLLIPSICKEQQGGMSECGATAGIGCVFWCNYRPVDQPLWWRWTLYVLYSSLYLLWLASTTVLRQCIFHKTTPQRISLKWWKTSSRSERYKERVYNRQSQLNEERLWKVSLRLVFLFWSQFKIGQLPKSPRTRYQSMETSGAEVFWKLETETRASKEAGRMDHPWACTDSRWGHHVGIHIWNATAGHLWGASRRQTHLMPKDIDITALVWVRQLSKEELLNISRFVDPGF